MGRRESPEISAGSMADIAFLLLIFFLVTTTMEKESGIQRILPEKANIEGEEVEKRNVIRILVNDNNLVLLNEQLVAIEDLEDRVAELILNKNKKADWPKWRPVQMDAVVANYQQRLADYEAAATESEKKAELKKLYKAELRKKAAELFGPDFVYSEHVVSIQATRGADYETYIELNNQVLGAYRQLKMRLAKKKWKKEAWSDLDAEQKDMLNLMVESKISEAQAVSGKK